MTANLLVVEDDPTLRELLAASLRFAGFAVSATASGARGAADGGRAGRRIWWCST